MSKLCLIFNTASHYRKGIYGLIDKEYDCEWYFAEKLGDIKSLPKDFFKEAHIIETKNVKSPVYWQKGVTGLMGRKDLRTFFVLGEPYALSTWVALMKLRLLYPKKKVYMWSHGWYGKEGKAKRIVKKRFFKMADGIFLYGNYARDLMIKEGFDPYKLFVIHNSLDYDKQLAIRQKIKATSVYHDHFGNDLPNLIFIGRLTSVKKLDLLIDALKSPKDRGMSYNLTFVGDGKERENLEERVKSLGLEKQVWFYGACYDEQTNAELIYNADLCVSPGNVGLTAMHSLMFGTPVLTHNNFAWQMPEFEAIHEGKTGGFFEQNNVESMSEAIKKWLEFHSTKDSREKVRQACYKEIDTSWTPEYQINVLRKHLIV